MKLHDEVILTDSRHSARYVARVIKVTATQVHVVIEQMRNSVPIKFNATSLLEITSDRFYKASIAPATPELLAEVAREARHRSLVISLSRYNWNKIDVDKLERIAAIINEP